MNPKWPTKLHPDTHNLWIVHTVVIGIPHANMCNGKIENAPPLLPLTHCAHIFGGVMQVMLMIKIEMKINAAVSTVNQSHCAINVLMKSFYFCVNLP